MPALLRTWPTVARSPVTRRRLSYDHLSAISAISMTGELYLAVQDHSYKGTDVIRFLEQLLEEIPGQLLVIWDGAPIHRSRAVRDWQAQGAAQRIQLEQLPAYAPELNPDEGVWHYLKRVELCNLNCAGLEELTSQFSAAARAVAGQTPSVASPRPGSSLCLLIHHLSVIVGKSVGSVG